MAGRGWFAQWLSDAGWLIVWVALGIAAGFVLGPEHAIAFILGGAVVELAHIALNLVQAWRRRGR